MGLKKEIKAELNDTGAQYVERGSVSVVVNDYGAIVALPSDVAYDLAEKAGIICDQPAVVEMTYDGAPLTVYVYEGV
jgi:hypothetical protein